MSIVMFEAVLTSSNDLYVFEQKFEKKNNVYPCNHGGLHYTDMLAWLKDSSDPDTDLPVKTKYVEICESRVEIEA